MKFKRIVLFLILLIVLVAGFVAYRMYTTKVDNYADGDPDITITSGELVAAFDKDTAAANKKFMDKVIRVTGVVKSFDSNAVVVGEEGSASDVVVGLDDRNLKDINQLRVGEKIAMQGKYSGYEKASGDDLLAVLGTTVHIDYAGIKSK